MKHIKHGIYILDEQRNLVPVDEWMTRENPTSAQTVVLATDRCTLEIAKEDLPGGFSFGDAQKAAAEYREGFRCPTRHEAIEMYDARFRGLDEAFRKIGGKPIDNDWRWTSEADPDPAYKSLYAFFYVGSGGMVRSYNKYGTLYVRPVSAFKNEAMKNQVTSIEQSNRLLELGVPGDKASMVWTRCGNEWHLSVLPHYTAEKECIESGGSIPAFTIPDLLEILPTETCGKKGGTRYTISIEYSRNEWGLFYDACDESADLIAQISTSLLELLYDCTEWLLLNEYKLNV